MGGIAIGSRHAGTEYKAAKALFPVEQILIDVGAFVIDAVDTVDDFQLKAPVLPLPRFCFRVACAQKGGSRI